MTLIVGQSAPAPKLTELPSVPCEFNEEMYELAGIPDLGALVADWLAEQHGDSGELVFRIPPTSERQPGPHVSHLGHAKAGGLCPRQLALRYAIEGQPSGRKEPVDVAREFGLMRGHAAEAFLMAILGSQLSQVGFRVERNVPCDYVHVSGRVFTGEADAIISGVGLPGPRHNEPVEFVLDSKETSDERLASMSSASPSNVLQQQGYLQSKIHDASFAVLVYHARFVAPRFFYVPRNEVAVHRAATEVIGLADSSNGWPPPLPPGWGERENKGANSLWLKMPWQCSYCEFLDTPKCKGAIPVAWRDLGIIAHREDKGKPVRVDRDKLGKEFGDQAGGHVEGLEGLLNQLIPMEVF